MFFTFLSRFNGTATNKHQLIEEVQTLAIDACLHRVGGIWKNQVDAAPIPSWLKEYDNMHLTHFEMIKIIIVIKLWGSKWVGQRVVLYTDNEAVVSICYTREAVLVTIVTNIWLHTAEKKFSYK